jgi:chromosome segregation ATPase
MPEKSEKWTGQVVSTGYTELTDEEFKILEKTSRTFAVYTGKTGKAELLAVCSELPPEAKTPHEALVDARKEARKSAGKITELTDEIIRLKASLLDAETRYKQLQSASGAEEALKLLQDENAKLKEALNSLQKERDAAVTDVGKLTTELEKAAKKGDKGKDFE